MRLKLQMSLFCVFGFFFFRIAGTIILRKIKDFHIKNKTGLVDKAPWFFKGFELFFKFMSIMCLVFIVLIWLGIGVAPSE